MRLCKDLIVDHNIQSGVSLPVKSMLTPLSSLSASQLAANIKTHIDDSKHTISTKFGIDRSTLTSIARDFHEKADTLTENVSKNLDSIAQGHPILLIPHQPNIFPSLSVICPFILLDYVASELREAYNTPSSQIYLIIDYDDCDDRRFRTASFPDLTRRDGFFSISSGLSRQIRGTPMWAIEKPKPYIVSNWLDEITQSIERNLAFIRKESFWENYQHYCGKVYDNLETVKRIIQEAYGLSSTLTEFNTIFLSRVINRIWGQSISFVPGHKIQNHLTPAKMWIFDFSKEIQHATADASSEIQNSGCKSSFLAVDNNQAQFWFYCRECKQRLPTWKDENLLLINKDCHNSNNCQHPTTLVKHDLISLGEHFLPRVIADDLLDIVALGKSGGTGYIGQAEHLLVSHHVAQVLGLHPPPQLIFSSRWIHLGLTELCYYCLCKTEQPINQWMDNALHFSFNGKASIIYYAISHGFPELRNGWYKYFASGGLPNLPRQDDFKLVGVDEEIAVKTHSLILEFTLRDRGT